MNGLERAYAAHLELRRCAREIHSARYEPITFKLSADLRYTPDFLVVKPDGALEFHECKGQMLPEGRAKIRVAATLFPEFRFVLIRQAGTKASPIWSAEEVPC